MERPEALCSWTQRKLDASCSVLVWKCCNVLKAKHSEYETRAGHEVSEADDPAFFKSLWPGAKPVLFHSLVEMIIDDRGKADAVKAEVCGLRSVEADLPQPISSTPTLHQKRPPSPTDSVDLCASTC